jgi:hypothetical protein
MLTWKSVTLVAMRTGQMAGRARVGIPFLKWFKVHRSGILKAACLLLLGCIVGASTDTVLLMQAPFSRDLGWTNASALCNSSTDTFSITCNGRDYVTYL